MSTIVSHILVAIVSHSLVYTPVHILVTILVHKIDPLRFRFLGLLVPSDVSGLEHHEARQFLASVAPHQRLNGYHFIRRAKVPDHILLGQARLDLGPCRQEFCLSHPPALAVVIPAGKCPLDHMPRFIQSTIKGFHGWWENKDSVENDCTDSDHKQKYQNNVHSVHSQPPSQNTWASHTGTLCALLSTAAAW